jgi:hypothetical protein
MRAQFTVTYNPEDPIEAAEIKLMQDARKWKGLVWDLDQALRERIKYGNEEALQPARELLWELLKDENLSLDE